MPDVHSRDLTVIVALLALLVNVVFVTFQVTWTLAKDQKDKKKK